MSPDKFKLIPLQREVLRLLKAGHPPSDIAHYSLPHEFGNPSESYLRRVIAALIKKNQITATEIARGKSGPKESLSVAGIRLTEKNKARRRMGRRLGRR